MIEIDNCGSCGNVCPAVANATAVCESFSCVRQGGTGRQDEQRAEHDEAEQHLADS